MRVVDFHQQPDEIWRPGVTTRMQASAQTGTSQLCLFQQWCNPGKGAPTHWHAVEEVLSVLTGTAEIWVENERSVVSAGQTVVIAAGQKHGFRNIGVNQLHIHATLASPSFEATFDDVSDVTRRWVADGWPVR